MAAELARIGCPLLGNDTSIMENLHHGLAGAALLLVSVRSTRVDLEMGQVVVGAAN